VTGLGGDNKLLFINRLLARDILKEIRSGQDNTDKNYFVVFNVVKAIAV